MKRGFSLFELLIVLSLFVILALLAGQVFFAALRGTAKTEVVRDVRQNAGFAVSVMERQLRNALKVESCDGTQVTYLDQDGFSTSFSCVGGTDSYIASGGARLTTPDVVVPSCSITCPVVSGTASVIEIDFSLEQKSGIRAEETAAYSVSTRVILRNQ